MRVPYATQRLGFHRGWAGVGVGGGNRPEEGLETLTPLSLTGRLGRREGHLCTSPQPVGPEAPSPGQAPSAWEAGWLGGALG